MQSISFHLRTWFVASRPHTLSASVVPVVVGGALAAQHTLFSWPLFGWTLLGAVLVQVGANFTDEFADHGTTQSAHKYLAPHKVIARGLLSERAVKLAAVLAFGLATGIGLWLVSRSGWPLLAVCLFSLAVAYLYSAGPLPLGDLALGELLVFFTMGPLMVMSTVYVQTLAWTPAALWFSLPVGALVTAILVVNNLRDAEEDRRNRRRTLATVCGLVPMLWLHRLLLAGAYLSLPAALLAGWNTPWILLPWLTLPLAAKALRLVRNGNPRDALHQGLKITSALHAGFGLLLAAALWAEHLGSG